MTRRLPPEQLGKSQALAAPQKLEPERVAADFFKGAPAEQMPAALAALYRFRPDLGGTVDPQLHAAHMLLWPRDDHYFLRLCRLLKWYGVGGQWGEP